MWFLFLLLMIPFDTREKIVLLFQMVSLLPNILFVKRMEKHIGIVLHFHVIWTLRLRNLPPRPKNVSCYDCNHLFHPFDLSKLRILKIIFNSKSNLHRPRTRFLTKSYIIHSFLMHSEEIFFYKLLMEIKRHSVKLRFLTVWPMPRDLDLDQDKSFKSVLLI